jgi:hypothetical protein
MVIPFVVRVGVRLPMKNVPVPVPSESRLLRDTDRRAVTYCDSFGRASLSQHTHEKAKKRASDQPVAIVAALRTTRPTVWMMSTIDRSGLSGTLGLIWGTP